MCNGEITQHMVCNVEITQHISNKLFIIVGRHIFTLYVMSDSYLGLDQQFDLHLDVKDSSASAP